MSTAEQRIAELESIVRAKCAMIDEIAFAAGYEVGEAVTVQGIISRLKQKAPASE